jgi:acyl carrier protein
MSVRDKVISLIANVHKMDRDHIIENLSFDEMGFNEMEYVELVMACQEEFGIDIKDSDASNFLTVGDCINFIDRHIKLI